MKDYSKYIKSEYGFITNIETNLENKTIEITTSKTKKRQPHIYKLNQENIKKLYQRLEKQYRILIENKDEILEQIKKETTKKYHWIFNTGVMVLLITALIAVSSIFLSNLFLMIPEIVGLLTGVAMTYGTNVIVNKKEKAFNNTIETYKYYLENRHEIERIVKQDENILGYSDELTFKQIEDNQQLVDENITEELFDIQFMDKVSLEQLKEMLERYQISKSLEEEQYFYIEEAEEEKEITEKSKTKTKK